MKLTEAARSKAQHICIFGDPKSGKTMLASTLTKFFKKVIYIVTDNGHECLFHLPKEQQDRIELVVLPDRTEFPVAFTTCRAIMKGAPVKICYRHGQVSCSTCIKDKKEEWTDICLNDMTLDEVMVFDHISGLVTSCMNFIMKGKEDKVEWDDYRKQGFFMDQFLTNIQQSVANIVCIAHTCETEMEDSSKRLVPLVGTVPFSRNAGKYFDHLIYCRLSNKKHNFGSSTTYSNSAMTGSRTNVAIEDIKDGIPTLLPFFDGTITSMTEMKTVPRIVEKVIKEVATASSQQSLKESSDEELLPVASDVDSQSVDSVGEITQTETVTAISEVIDTAIPVAIPSDTPTMSASEKAKAMLAAMRAKKN